MTALKENQKENTTVTQALKTIENMDATYINSESAVVAQKQPFLISMLLGYRLDLEEYELEEIMKIIFLTWECFKDSKLVQKNKISEVQFNRLQKQNAYMLKYFEGEKSEQEKQDFITSDLNNLSSKALFAEIVFRFKQRKHLLSIKEKGIVLIGMKTLVECFEEIKFKK